MSAVVEMAAELSIMDHVVVVVGGAVADVVCCCIHVL